MKMISEEKFKERIDNHLKNEIIFSDDVNMDCLLDEIFTDHALISGGIHLNKLLEILDDIMERIYEKENGQNVVEIAKKELANFLETQKVILRVLDNYYSRVEKNMCIENEKKM